MPAFLTLLTILKSGFLAGGGGGGGGGLLTGVAVTGLPQARMTAHLKTPFSTNTKDLRPPVFAPYD